MRILLLEDNRELAGRLARRIRSAGFIVDHMETIESAALALADCAYAVALLDRRLPDGDGLQFIPRIREKQPGIRILMLTALDAVDDRIEGLDAGADDYLTKPFNPRELLARVHAVLRRRPAQEAPGAPSSDNEVVTFGPFAFDLGARTLHKNGEELPLTTGEFAMLKALVRHPRQPLSREKLAQLARGREFEPFDRSLDVQVSRLRKLIEQDPASPRYIQTVWGVGYVFVPDGNA